MSTLQALRTNQLRGAKELKLAEGLREFPPEIFDLADTLEVLDLSGNALSTLPDELPRLHQLRILFCSNNAFTVLPEVIGQCPRLSMVGFKANRIHTLPPDALPPGLRWLILTDNELETLPASIGQCHELQKLMLAGNRLHALPDELAYCSKLELLRIAANRLTRLPDWLLTLPRLCWLAYAGNPFCHDLEQATRAHTSLPLIHWHELQIDQALGEGASGIIHQAGHINGQGRVPLAVKLFKGAMTSDGLPQSEMAACMAAGQHPNLITATGTITGHPQRAEGLTMPLIASHYRNLAGPPSMASCTRDVYRDDTQFEPAHALTIAHGIASAARQLHDRGILHGDLYAHNVLHDDKGHALLGDFGAASLYPQDAAHAMALQQMEVRAFGCLLEELIERCPLSTDSASHRHTLAELKTACLDDRVNTRPLFAQVTETLAPLMP